MPQNKDLAAIQDFGGRPASQQAGLVQPHQNRRAKAVRRAVAKKAGMVQEF